MAVIAVTRGFSFGRPELSAAATLRFGLLYLVGFVLVGLFEEASFRGYLQATLQQTMGFWPAALILAALFGATHLGNSSEARYGAFMAGCFGLFEAFLLFRTGNLWFAIGIHAGWDWGETFFYSAPDSGILATGHLANSSLHGPVWLSGGIVRAGSERVLRADSRAGSGCDSLPVPKESAGTGSLELGQSVIRRVRLVR